MLEVAPANEEAVEAWNGVLFDRFVQYRDLMVAGLGAHGERAMELYPPQVGWNVLDIGCGFGDTAQDLARLVGPAGSVLGVDAAERFIEVAIDEAAATGVENVRFEAGDLETTHFDETFDMAYSRMGTMFFANPVAALRNVAAALKPGGRLVMVVWRQKPDNDWLHSAELVVERYLEHEDNPDEPTCGPGPFSMANADTTSGIMHHAGFENIALHRCDRPLLMGRDLEEAIALTTAIGPAAEVIRLAGEKANAVRPEIEEKLSEAFQQFVTDDGVIGMASTWIATGTKRP